VKKKPFIEKKKAVTIRLNEKENDVAGPSNEAPMEISEKVYYIYLNLLFNIQKISF
jgi:hypothetical protein